MIGEETAMEGLGEARQAGARDRTRAWMFTQHGAAVSLREPLTKRYRPRAVRSTKLDGYRDYIAGRVRAALPAAIPAKVLLGEIGERGYCGGYTMVKTYVASLRTMVVAEHCGGGRCGSPPPPISC